MVLAGGCLHHENHIDSSHDGGIMRARQNTLCPLLDFGLLPQKIGGPQVEGRQILRQATVNRPGVIRTA